MSGLESEPTPVEVRALQMLADGVTVEQIAATVNVTPKTVSNYLLSIQKRLGAKNRSNAVLLGLRAGVIE